MIKKKNIRIKSKLRFTIFILLLLLGISCACMTIRIHENHVHGSAPSQYIKVTVMSGETMWEIASRFKAETADTREVVYQIQKANQMDSSELTAGETIRVPVESNECQSN